MSKRGSVRWHRTGRAPYNGSMRFRREGRGGKPAYAETAIGGDGGLPRPLVVRFGAIGDMIVLSALLRGLGSWAGRPCDVVGSGGAPRQVYAHLPEAGEVFTIGSRRTPYWLSGEQRRLVAWLRRRGATPAGVVEDMDKVFWLLERGGLGPGDVLSARDVPRGDLEHVLSHLHRMLAALPDEWRGRAMPPLSGDGEEAPGGGTVRPHPGTGFVGTAPSAEPQPRIVVTEEEREDARRWIASRGWEGRPLVLVQTRSRRAKRGRWPDGHWISILSGVLARLPDARAVLIGSPAEEAALAELMRACGDPRVEMAAADLPLRRLFALCTQAHSCISLDTGPAHAAAVLGCPLTVLVGMADPRRNHPVPNGSPVRMVTSVAERHWPDSRAGWESWHRVEDIPVAPVLAAWEETHEAGRGSGASVAYLSG